MTEKWQMYQDFVIKIDKGGDVYEVTAQGPTGEAKTTFTFDAKDVTIFLLQIGQRQRMSGHRGVPKRMRQTADFGGKLYDAVLSGRVGNLFATAQHDAQQKGYGLRIKLRLVETPELADWPWEFLYNGRDFLALSTDTPLVRYLDLPHPPRPLKCALPLRVLVTISAPRDSIPLDVKTEERKVREALASLEERGRVEIQVMSNITLQDLQRELRRAKRSGKPYQVWHYIGHGGFDEVEQSSVLLFCDKDGKPGEVGGFYLSTLFNSYPEIKLALLNACEGARAGQDPFAGVAAALVERGVSAVIGMQFAISDEAAILFSEEFYTALVDGLPIDAAVTEARRAVFFMPNQVEWATPVLYMRAPDGVLFDIPDIPKRDEPAQTQISVPVKRDELPKSKVVVQPSAGDRKVREKDGKEMVFVEGGVFLYGDDKQEIDLPAFWIDRTPVTNAEYAKFVKETGRKPPKDWKKGKPPQGKENHPVVYVNWHDATAYAEWAGGRLPTEEEWEKAARGTDGRMYPWGDDVPTQELCNFNMNEGSTTPVGKYSPPGDSPYGCVDMAGNVWEWTSSAHEDGERLRVLRGGSWFDYQDYARCAYRYGYLEDLSYFSRGFRLVSPSVF